MDEQFKDRCDAGRQLAAAVVRLQAVDPLVLALPRGGVPVAAEVARALGAPLDLLIVRKIGAPNQPELAVAAMTEGDPPTLSIDERLAWITGADAAYLEREANRQHEEIERRCKDYRRGRARMDVAGKTAIVIDDGVATGTTVRAALRVLRRMRPARLVLAVPVGAAETLAALAPLVDDLVCLSQPAQFRAVGLCYEDFRQVRDEEVIALLDAARSAHEE